MTKTVTDKRIDAHVKAIGVIDTKFQAALAAGDLSKAFKYSDKEQALSEKYPDAWAIVAKSHGFMPSGEPMAPSAVEDQDQALSDLLDS